MKKAIKNYLAKLQENDKKGFSLVELIIVMAIMAILVGIVASQVIPYMEKSRQSKDQQQLSSIATNLVSAIAQDASWDQSVSGSDDAFELKDLSTKTKPTGFTGTQTTIEKTFLELSGWTDTDGSLKSIDSYAKQFYGSSATKCVSKKAKDDGKKLMVTLKTDGSVIVSVTDANGNDLTEKLTVKSE
jgi:prepilin-type N-terminal cleavage/methylation domain-containing protein